VGCTFPAPARRTHGAAHRWLAPRARRHYDTSMIACLFDIDGTLLASGGAGKAALEASLTGEFNVELHTHIPYAGRTDRPIIRDLLGEHGLADSPQNVRTLLAGYLRRLPD